MLDHGAATALDGAAHDPVVVAQQVHRAAVAELLGEAVEPTMSVNRIDAEGRVDIGLARFVRSAPRTQEARHLAGLDLDDIGGQPAVSLAMDGDDRVAVGAIGQAERALAVVVEPVGQVAHAEAVLDGHVLDVGGGHSWAVASGRSWRSRYSGMA